MGYSHNVFLISLQNHMLCVLIRSASAHLMSTHKIYFHGYIRKYQCFSVEKSTLSAAMDIGYNIIINMFCRKIREVRELVLCSKSSGEELPEPIIPWMISNMFYLFRGISLNCQNHKIWSQHFIIWLKI